MKDIQKFITYFLAFWFSVTVIPEMLSNTNDFIDVSIAAFGFALLTMFVPFVLVFFKLPERNPSAKILVGGLLTLAYVFVLKPGITGLLYIPPKVSVGDTIDILKNYAIDLNEFGIIILIVIISVLLVSILDLKKK